MKRRILSTWLALCMMLALLPGTALAADNSCGISATWELSDLGVLTISGSGRMTDYSSSSNTPWYNRRQEITKVVVGNGITSVGSYAFGGCNQLTSVTLPNSLTAIGNYAFTGCYQLTSVAIPNNVKSIGAGAFYYCEKLTKISIPAGVTAIEYDTFYPCNYLKTIDYGGTEAQWNKIWIHPNNYQYMFSANAKINYAGSPNTQTLCSGNLGGSDNAAGYRIIWTLGKDGVLTISGAGAMPNDIYPWRWRGKDIASINIGNNISRIGKYSFYDCDAVSSITIPGNVASIGERAFYSCDDLAEVNIQEGTTSIDKYAFYSCPSLTTVTIPSSMAIIGYNAFDDCKRLLDVYYAGTKDQWGEMQINYDFPISCEIHYSSTPPAPAVNYTVTLDANGGTVPEGAESITVEEGAAIGTLPTPTRNGYSFNGWFTAMSGGEKVTGSTPVTGDMTIYAQWTKNVTVTTYTITLDANGGTVSPGSLKVDSGKTYYDDLPTPTRTGYKFNGWYSAASGGSKLTASVKATANRTIYAHWTKEAVTKTYKITLNANGGKVSPASLTVESGKTYFSSLPTPTRTGYTFAGWYSAKSGGTKITASTKATANRALYAHWTRTRSFLVTFDPNKGSIYQDMKIVVSGGTYRELPTPTRPNYHFKGWYTAKSGGKKVTAGTRVSLTGNQTLYAQWQSAATAKVQNGKWTVTIPSYYELAVYSTQTAKNILRTENLAETTGGCLGITCTKMATLSNGTTRYYGNVNGKNVWFTYSCEMDVK